MPKPSPNSDIRIANPVTEPTDGSSPAADIMASIDTARIILRLKAPSSLPNISLMDVDIIAKIDIPLNLLCAAEPAKMTLADWSQI
jgi:hypothetical protein